MLKKPYLFCYLMIAPAVILVLGLGLYPMLDSLRLSVFQYDLMRISTEGTPFIGLKNFQEIFTSSRFLQVFINTLSFMIVAVSGVTILGLLIAQVLNKDFTGRGTVRTLVLIPWFIPPMVAASVWIWMYQPERSPINQMLKTFGLIETNIRFLTDISWFLGPLSIPFFAVALVRVWHGLPFVTTFILAGLQSISSELYEAAEIDGANRFQKFFLITLPMLKPVLRVLITLLAIGGIGHFEVNYILTGGGPQDMTNVLPVMAYTEAFVFYRFDLASAISCVILVLTGIIGVLYVRRYFKGSEEEGKRRSKRRDFGFKIASLFSIKTRHVGPQKKSRGGVWSWRVIVILFVVAILLFTLFPYYWMLKSSFQTPRQIRAIPNQWIPKTPTFKGYSRALKVIPLARYMMNSILVSSMTAIVATLVASMVAYVLVRYQFKGATLVLALILFTQLIPAITRVFPIYFLIQRLGLLNNYFGLLVAYMGFSVPFAALLLHGYFRTSCPVEIEEAALVDGCSRWRVFTRVVVPISIPGIAATAIFTFLGAWNDFLWASLLLSQGKMKTIQVGLRDFLTEAGSVQHINALMAACVLTTIPSMLAFRFLQKGIVGGISAGSIKE